MAVFPASDRNPTRGFSDSGDEHRSQRAVVSATLSRRIPARLLRVFSGLVALFVMTLAVNVDPQQAKAGAADVARVSIVNDDPNPIQVVVNDLVHTPRLPPGATLEFALEPRQHIIEVRPNGAAVSSNRQSSMSIDLAASEMVSFRATSVALTFANRVAKIGKRASLKQSAPEPLGFRAPKGVSLLSVLTGVVGLGAGTAFLLSQLVIERARVRDDRASARMQQMASQTLSSLPALSMDVKARTRRA
jgi:hypothetical protein